MAQVTERTSLIMQETAGDGRSSGSQSPDTPSLPARSVFGREFRLICPICLQDLKRPRQLLSCYHIFCANCIRPSVENAQDGKVVCPAGNCKITSSQEVSCALDSDTYIHAFKGHTVLYAESGKVSCSEASHGEAVPAGFFCLECKQNLCDDCHSNHKGNEEFSGHHCLKLFQSAVTMTVGMNRASTRATGAAATLDDVDASGKVFKCPICRNTDWCLHEKWLQDLSSSSFLENDQCPIPDHAPENRLIAYCTVCLEPICRNCSMIEHKDHKTINISGAKEDKLLELKMVKKEIGFKLDIFDDAYKSAEKEADFFENHVSHTEQEMIRRKGEVQTKVEEGFNVAYQLIEQTGQKQSELNRQSEEMLEEAEFVKTAAGLAEKMSQESAPALAVVRAWKGLDLILNAMLGKDKGKQSPQETADVVLPQKIVEKRLVLPAPNCMVPDLRILQKVGVEGTVLRKSFILKADDELLLFYSILPLTETEALVSCKTDAFASSVVQYSNVDRKHHSIGLEESGQYCIIAVPGNGLVATLYQDGKTPGTTKKEVLFWDHALDRSIKQHEASKAGDSLKSFATTPLPPRGLAATRDNHLVICTAEDPRSAGEEGRSCIILMTMRGDVIDSKVLDVGTQPSNGKYFPRYVTVNINNDVCVTDSAQQAIFVLSSDLDHKTMVKNPYNDDKLNENFCPMGICHDNFGRLILADNLNHRVLRVVVDETAGNPQVEVILQNDRDGVSDLTYPTLVALGPGPKLWVVCKENIHVFDYMDKE